MQNFTMYTPTEVVFGKDAQKQVGQEVKKFGGSRVLLVYGGKSAVQSGVLDQIKKVLDEAEIAHEEIGGVKPNPRLSLVEKGVEVGLAFQADMVLAVGGGSVIDTAKGIAHGMANPGVDLWDIWTLKVPLEKTTPVGVVLTLAAAGSEMSNSAVLTNEKVGKKAGINTDLNRPKFAVMNPEFTYSIPRFQLTCGIVDIMMHTLERYFAPERGNQLTDEIAEGLLRTVIENGKRALENQEDYDAMSELMWCSTVSHNGWTGLGRRTVLAIHKMGHELGAKFDVAHGASLSALWGAWAMCSYEADSARFKQYGEKVWGIQAENEKEAALAAIYATVDFFASLDMPTSIEALPCGALSEEVLMELAVKALGDKTGMISQLKEYKLDDVYEIFQKANRA